MPGRQLRDADARAIGTEAPAVVRTDEAAVVNRAEGERGAAVQAPVLGCVNGTVLRAPEHDALVEQGGRERSVAERGSPPNRMPVAPEGVGRTVVVTAAPVRSGPTSLTAPPGRWHSGTDLGPRLGVADTGGRVLAARAHGKVDVAARNGAHRLRCWWNAPSDRSRARADVDGLFDVGQELAVTNAAIRGLNAIA